MSSLYKRAFAGAGRKIMKFLKRFGKKKLLFIGLVLLIVLSMSTAAVSTLGKADSRFSDINIYLSPSNQYDNTYASGNTTEMEQCDKIAAQTAEKLEKLGFNVMVGKSGASLDERCSESDNFKADMHIPIHTNALNGEYTGGTHIYVYGADERDAAQCFYDTLGKISPGDDDRIEYNPGLYEIRIPNALTVYLECEFHDTKDGADWIINNTDKIAQAIADGVYNYYSNIE